MRWEGKSSFTLAIILVGLVCGSAQAATIYWNGTLGGSWNSNPNWDDGSGNPPPAVPGDLDDVVFYVSGAGNLTNTLDANFTINSLTLNATATEAVTIGSGGAYTLTLGNAGSGGGISVDAAAGGLTISADVALGATQTWTNANTTAALTATGGLNLGTYSLTLAGAGNFALGGAISGSGSLTMDAAGTATLGGANDFFTGNLNMNAGTLALVTGASLSGVNTLYFNGTGAAAAVFQLNGVSATFAGLLGGNAADAA